MAEAERIKGNEAIKSKDYQEAIGYYTASLGFDPRMYQSYSNRALAYLKTKGNLSLYPDYQKCIEDCENALKIDSTHIKAYHRKAKALIGQGKTVPNYQAKRYKHTDVFNKARESSQITLS